MMNQLASNPETVRIQSKQTEFLGQSSNSKPIHTIRELQNNQQPLNSVSSITPSNHQIGTQSQEMLQLETLKTFQQTGVSLDQSFLRSHGIREMPSIKMDMQQPSDLKKNSSLDEKKLSKKAKRRKILTREPQQFLPDLLVCLSEYHYRHTIRQGWKYQAVIPQQSGHRHKTHKLVCICKSDNGFDDEVFKEFKLRFGENRNQEELCMIKLQLQCNWKEIPRYLEANKEVYKKIFKDKDKNPIKTSKITN